MNNSTTLEYELEMMSMLELIWGKGFITPGGEGNVDRIVEGVDLEGKQILEIGSGLGGGAMVLAAKYCASVLGLEIEGPLVERATQYAENAGLSGQIEFRQVAPGAFPVPDSSVDFVYCSGVLCHFEDKPGAFADVYRVLKPGGMFLGYDWLKGPDALSDRMHEWMTAAGLTLYPDTLENYVGFLVDAGFDSVSSSDASNWYKQRATEEFELMSGPFYEEMAVVASPDARDQFIEEWRTMRIVLNSGELKSGYMRGRKP